MMMMTRKYCVLLFVIFVPLVVVAQEKDFGIWYGISAEHKLSKKLEIDLSTSVRTYSHASKIEEAFVEGGLTYSLYRNLSIAGFYRLTKSIENNDSYYLRHKYMLDIKGNLPVGNISFSGRFRFQTTIKNYIKDEIDKFPFYTGRIKLKAVYKTPTFPLNPYVYIESFCPMFSAKSGTIEKNRYSAGMELSIAKHHSVEAEYIFQRDYQPHISDINIISVNYDIKF
jgi:hypothetical protein